MVPPHTQTRSLHPHLARWFPRTRGDRPEEGKPQEPAAGSPAHAGIEHTTLLAINEGSPAHAGIDPGTVRAARSRMGSPAHAGIDPGTVRAARSRMGSPAHAGIDP